jgi:23S rRNA (pseudouridine1915-N3)-methyltransferase
MIIIIAVGKVTTKGLKESMHHYLKQMKHIDIIEIKESNPSDEAQKIIKYIKPNDHIITLEIDGDLMTSETLSTYIDDKQQHIRGNILFIIGGHEGLGNDIKALSNKEISLSKMTFPHQIARLILIEQLYRVYKIQSHHPYHK